MTDPKTSLGATLERWLRHERLRPVHVSRAGGVSPRALLQARTGKTAHPKPETIEQIALGLATDPHTFELNLALARRIADDLRWAGDSGESPGPMPGCPGPSAWCWTSSGGFCAKYVAGR